MKHIALITSLLALTGTGLCAQQAASPNEDSTVVISSAEANDTDTNADAGAGPAAPYVIFSNLGPKQNRYHTDVGFPLPVVGRQVDQMTEQWNAVRFVPKVDVQASVLEAAVQYIEGTRSLQLSVYDSNGLFGFPGAPLPGAQGATADIPDVGECCQLAKVTLAQPVTLFANTIYWIVASPGSKDFNGVWQFSHIGDRAGFSPTYGWILGPSAWPAARVSGTKLETLGPKGPEGQRSAEIASEISTGRVTIFSNITPFFRSPIPRELEFR